MKLKLIKGTIAGKNGFCERFFFFSLTKLLQTVNRCSQITHWLFLVSESGTIRAESKPDFYYHSTSQPIGGKYTS